MYTRFFSLHLVLFSLPLQFDCLVFFLLHQSCWLSSKFIQKFEQLSTLIHEYRQHTVMIIIIGEHSVMNIQYMDRCAMSLNLSINFVCLVDRFFWKFLAFSAPLCVYVYAQFFFLLISKKKKQWCRTDGVLNHFNVAQNDG